MADKDKAEAKDEEAVLDALDQEESDEVRKANEENVKKASDKPTELELREADIHPSGLNANWETPRADHKTGLNMHELSVEDQAKRRNLR